MIHLFLDAIKLPNYDDVPSWDGLSDPELLADCKQITRNSDTTVYESMRLNVDAFISHFLDLILFKKFARDTYNALHGTEVYVWRLEFEVGVMLSDERPRMGQLSLLLSLMTMVSHGVYNDGNLEAGNWVRSSVFASIIDTLVKKVAIYSSEIFSMLINVLDCIVQEDPDAASAIKSMVSAGIFESVWNGIKSSVDDMSTDCLEELSTLMIHVSSSSEDCM